MGKQEPPRSRGRGHLPGSADKTPAKKLSGNIEKYVSSKMEKSISSVKIKKERLSETSITQAKVIVSPDKVKLRRLIKEKRSKSPKPKVDYVEMKETRVIDLVTNDEESDNGSLPEFNFPEDISRDNVSTNIENTRLGQLLSLPIDKMRSVVKAWKIRQKDDNPESVKTLTFDDLMLDILKKRKEK